MLSTASAISAVVFPGYENLCTCLRKLFWNGAKAWNGERDRLYARQGGLKLHLPRGFVPIIHIGHVKRTERHDADCLRCFNVVPFLYRVGVGPSPSPRARGSPGAQTGTPRDFAFPYGWTCQKSYPLSSCDVGVDPTARGPTGGRTCASRDSAPW